jgi:hypothetical protein
VDRYDHHCPWINNCVGIRNHNIFLWYLIFQMATLVTTLVQTTNIVIMFHNYKEETLNQTYNDFNTFNDLDLDQ